MNRIDKNNIQQVLNDLYELDPSMQKQEKEIKQILMDLLSSKENISIDDKFIERLKERILLVEKDTSSVIEYISFLKHRFVFGGAIALVLVVGFGGYLFLYPSTNNLDSQVVAISPGGFGSLSDSEISPIPSAIMLQPADGASEKVGVVTESAVAAIPVIGSGGGGGGMRVVSDDSAFSIYPYYSYEYKYVGDEFTTDEKTLPVYRQKTKGESDRFIKTFFTDTDTGIIDLSSFDDAKVDMLMVSSDDGYSVSVDYRGGTANIHRNRSYETEKFIDTDEIMEEEQIIQIANLFLEKHGIDMSFFADPVIDENWNNTVGMEYETFAPAPYRSFVNVTYPIDLEGNIAYEMNGVPTGLGVSVNVSDRRVESVWNISFNQYEKSEYEIETDYDTIIAFAEQGGLSPGYTPQGAKVQVIELGSPEIVYAIYHKFDQEKEQTTTFFVPTLKFPIVSSQTKDQVYRSNVMIPIAKEILSQTVAGGSIEPMSVPEPMILMTEEMPEIDLGIEE